MNQGYPFLPGNGPETGGDDIALRRRTKVVAAAILTVLTLGDTVYFVVRGKMHDLRLIVTVALWIVLALVWYWISRDRGKQ